MDGVKRGLSLAKPDGSFLAKVIIVNHKDFRITGFVTAVNSADKTFTIAWRKRRGQRALLVIHWTDATQVMRRGHSVPVSTIAVGRRVHVAGNGTNDGLVPRRVWVLWRGDR